MYTLLTFSLHVRLVFVQVIPFDQHSWQRRERKRMYVFRGVLKMHQKEGKITKNIYTQHKTYLLNVFLLKNNFTERNPLYYNLHVTERTVMLLVIVSLPSPFLPQGDVFCWEGRKGNKDHHNSPHPPSNTPISSSFLFSA